MSITIYSLGDHETIRAALTGVVMIFDPSKEMLTGSGLLGLGHFAGFGLLISFAFVCAGIILKQKIEFEHVILVAIAYAVLFVPTTTVMVEDMHTGQVAVVDKVPVGIAYPGGVISSFTRSVAVTIEQVMRDASSEYIPQTDVGFVAPLKLLLSARHAAVGDPYFAKNYTYFTTDCVVPSIDIKAASNLTDLREIFSSVIASAYTSGAATLYFSKDSNVGDLRACDAVAVQLETDYSTLLSGTDSTISGSVPLSSVEGRMNAGMDKKPGIGSTVKWSQADLSQAIETLSGAGIDAQKMIAALVLGDLTHQTFNCGKLGTAEYLTCSASLTQAMEQYKADSAGQATMFQKTMIPAMNIFMFFFYAFSPLVALLVAMSGMKGLMQIVPKYMLFGVWTQSWVPAAAIINFFIQKQTQEAISGRLVNGNGIPLSNVMELYNTLTIKIAAASDLLAQAPLVTLALISGSMFALAQMAGKAGDKYDEKITTPDAMKVGSAAQTDSRFVSAPNISTSGNTNIRSPAGTFAAGALTGGMQLGYSSDVASSVAAKQNAAMENASQQQISLASSAGTEFGRMLAGSNSLAHGSAASSTFNQGHGHAFEFGKNLAKGMQNRMSEAEGKSLDFSLNKMGEATSAALTQGAKMGLGGKALKNFVGQAVAAFAKDGLPKLAGQVGAALPSASMTEQFMSQVDKSISEQFGSSEKETDSWAAQFSSGNTSKSEQTFSDQASQGFKSSFSEQLSSARSSMQKHGEAAERAKTMSQKASASTTFDEKRAGVVGGTSSSFMEWARQAVSDNNLGGQVQALSDRLGKMGVFTEAGQESKREAAAMSWALSQTGHAPETAMRLAAAESGVDNMSFMPSRDQVEGQAGNVFGGAGGAGLSKSDQSRVGSAASRSQAAAGQAGQQTASVPGLVAQRQAAAGTQVGGSDFDAMSTKADSAAGESAASGRNSERVTAMPHTSAFAEGSAKMQAAFKSDHGFAELVGKFGKEMMDNPALAGIAAVGGTAAAASALSSIRGHHMAGLGGGGMSLPEYAGKVLSKVGSKLPGVAGAAVARHGAATAAGAAGLGVGVAALNAVSLVNDAADVIGAVKDAMNEVDKGLSGGSPFGYVQQTLNSPN